MDWLLELPIASEKAFTVMLVILAGCFLVGITDIFRKGCRKRTIISFIVAFSLTVLGWLIYAKWWRPFEDAVPLSIVVSIGIVVFLIVIASVVHSQRLRRRIVVGFALVVSLIATAGVFNCNYQVYPTLSSINPEPTSVSMSYEQFQKAKKAPDVNGRKVGANVKLDIAATTSGFGHRESYAYIPPAYFDNPSLKLPVVVMLAGLPGTPSQWFAQGGAEFELDLYQQRHNGRAPIVVAVDATGTYAGNPACVDSSAGNVQTYLAVDTPAQIKAKFRVDPDQRTWTIGGLSYGGTCALQTIANVPDSYGAFLNFSGQAEPTFNNHQDTVNKYFGGDEQAFQKVNALTILRNAAGTKKFAGIEGRFVAGTKDKESQDALTALNKAARAAGMKTDCVLIPGGHDFRVWRHAFRENMEFIIKHGGMRW